MTRTVMTSRPSSSILPSVTDCGISVFRVAWGQGTRFRRKLIENTRRYHLTNDLCEFSRHFNLEYKQLTVSHSSL